MGKLLEPVDGGVGSLPLSGRVGIINKCRIKDRFQNVVDGMINHPVSIGSGTDQALFRFVDLEMTVPSRLISLLLKLSLETPKFPFQMKIETASGRYLNWASN